MLTLLLLAAQVDREALAERLDAALRKGGPVWLELSLDRIDVKGERSVAARMTMNLDAGAARVYVEQERRRCTLPGGEAREVKVVAAERRAFPDVKPPAKVRDVQPPGVEMRALLLAEAERGVQPFGARWYEVMAGSATAEAGALLRTLVVGFAALVRDEFLRGAAGEYVERRIREGAAPGDVGAEEEGLRKAWNASEETLTEALRKWVAAVAGRAETASTAIGDRREAREAWRAPLPDLRKVLAGAVERAREH